MLDLRTAGLAVKAAETSSKVKNISFGLFAAEELVSASGTSIPADGLIEIISLSENGKAVIKTDLPFGSYYVKELATDEHYILSDSNLLLIPGVLAVLQCRSHGVPDKVAKIIRIKVLVNDLFSCQNTSEWADLFVVRN